ncbi:universal stress protein [Oceanomicrobium pacificus]|uniref:Universal stress protein n=1 Tax=Oceanomicrobium pacificus TaxID=2692916 RepID=A0A6B0TPF4_9RHOB|nr:universal stress protein [Oceanomicrobium pacificus]MXU66520.1 universal stress protein [Oceanomicrobium pacificus]
MTIRTILTVVSDLAEASELDEARRIATAFDAHLTIAVMGLCPPPPASPYGVVNSDLWAQEANAGREAAKARAEGFEQLLQTAGERGSAYAHYVDLGSVATLVARFARYADLTLIQPLREGEESLRQATLNGALFESGRPVVLLPEAGCAFPDVERAVIAWDASVEASKAVRDALPLLKKAKSVTAVLVDPEPSFDGHGPEPGADLATYLGRHGIELDVHRVPSEGQDVSRAITRFAEDQGAGLVVMGGFGHSRLRQRIFGGTTSRIVRSVTTPVLMSH